MNPIGQHITNAVNAGRVKNAAEVARLLKVSRPTVSRWMSGENAPSAEEARALADLIGAPEGLIMAECEATRAKDDATRSAWLRVARMCARQKEAATQLTLALLAVVTLFVSIPTKHAEASTAYSGAARVIHIMVVLGHRAGARGPSSQPPSGFQDAGDQG